MVALATIRMLRRLEGQAWRVHRFRPKSMFLRGELSCFLPCDVPETGKLGNAHPELAASSAAGSHRDRGRCSYDGIEVATMTGKG